MGNKQSNEGGGEMSPTPGRRSRRTSNKGYNGSMTPLLGRTKRYSSQSSLSSTTSALSTQSAMPALGSDPRAETLTRDTPAPGAHTGSLPRVKRGFSFKGLKKKGLKGLRGPTRWGREEPPPSNLEGVHESDGEDDGKGSQDTLQGSPPTMPKVPPTSLPTDMPSDMPAPAAPASSNSSPGRQPILGHQRGKSQDMKTNLMVSPPGSQGLNRAQSQPITPLIDSANYSPAVGLRKYQPPSPLPTHMRGTVEANKSDTLRGSPSGSISSLRGATMGSGGLYRPVASPITSVGAFRDRTESQQALDRSTGSLVTMGISKPGRPNALPLTKTGPGGGLYRSPASSGPKPALGLSGSALKISRPHGGAASPTGSNLSLNKQPPGAPLVTSKLAEAPNSSSAAPSTTAGSIVTTSRPRTTAPGPPTTTAKVPTTTGTITSSGGLPPGAALVTSKPGKQPPGAAPVGAIASLGKPTPEVLSNKPSTEKGIKPEKQISVAKESSPKSPPVSMAANVPVRVYSHASQGPEAKQTASQAPTKPSLNPPNVNSPALVSAVDSAGLSSGAKPAVSASPPPPGGLSPACHPTPSAAIAQPAVEPASTGPATCAPTSPVSPSTVVAWTPISQVSFIKPQDQTHIADSSLRTQAPSNDRRTAVTVSGKPHSPGVHPTPPQKQPQTGHTDNTTSDKDTSVKHVISSSNKDTKISGNKPQKDTGATSEKPVDSGTNRSLDNSVTKLVKPAEVTVKSTESATMGILESKPTETKEHLSLKTIGPPAAANGGIAQHKHKGKVGSMKDPKHVPPGAGKPQDPPGGTTAAGQTPLSSHRAAGQDTHGSTAKPAPSSPGIQHTTTKPASISVPVDKDKLELGQVSNGVPTQTKPLDIKPGSPSSQSPVAPPRQHKGTPTDSTVAIGKVTEPVVTLGLDTGVAEIRCSEVISNQTVTDHNNQDKHVSHDIKAHNTDSGDNVQPAMVPAVSMADQLSAVVTAEAMAAAAAAGKHQPMADDLKSEQTAESDETLDTLCVDDSEESSSSSDTSVESLIEMPTHLHDDASGTATPEKGGTLTRESQGDFNLVDNAEKCDSDINVKDVDTSTDSETGPETTVSSEVTPGAADALVPLHVEQNAESKLQKTQSPPVVSEAPGRDPVTAVIEVSENRGAISTDVPVDSSNSLSQEKQSLSENESVKVTQPPDTLVSANVEQSQGSLEAEPAQISEASGKQDPAMTGGSCKSGVGNRDQEKLIQDAAGNKSVSEANLGDKDVAVPKAKSEQVRSEVLGTKIDQDSINLEQAPVRSGRSENVTNVHLIEPPTSVGPNMMSISPRLERALFEVDAEGNPVNTDDYIKDDNSEVDIGDNENKDENEPEIFDLELHPTSEDNNEFINVGSEGVVVDSSECLTESVDVSSAEEPHVSNDVRTNHSEQSSTGDDEAVCRHEVLEAHQQLEAHSLCSQPHKQTPPAPGIQALAYSENNEAACSDPDVLASHNIEQTSQPIDLASTGALGADIGAYAESMVAQVMVQSQNDIEQALPPSTVTDNLHENIGVDSFDDNNNNEHIAVKADNKSSTDVTAGGDMNTDNPMHVDLQLDMPSSKSGVSGTGDDKGAADGFSPVASGSVSADDKSSAATEPDASGKVSSQICPDVSPQKVLIAPNVGQEPSLSQSQQPILRSLSAAAAGLHPEDEDEDVDEDVDEDEAALPSVDPSLSGSLLSVTTVSSYYSVDSLLDDGSADGKAAILEPSGAKAEAASDSDMPSGGAEVSAASNDCDVNSGSGLDPCGAKASVIIDHKATHGVVMASDCAEDGSSDHVTQMVGRDPIGTKTYASQQHVTGASVDDGGQTEEDDMCIDGGAIVAGDKVDTGVDGDISHTTEDHGHSGKVDVDTLENSMPDGDDSKTSVVSDQCCAVTHGHNENKEGANAQALLEPEPETGQQNTDLRKVDDSCREQKQMIVNTKSEQFSNNKESVPTDLTKDTLETLESEGDHDVVDEAVVEIELAECLNSEQKAVSDVCHVDHDVTLQQEEPFPVDDRSSSLVSDSGSHDIDMEEKSPEEIMVDSGVSIATLEGSKTDDSDLEDLADLCEEGVIPNSRDSAIMMDDHIMCRSGSHPISSPGSSGFHSGSGLVIRSPSFPETSEEPKCDHDLHEPTSVYETEELTNDVNTHQATSPVSNKSIASVALCTVPPLTQVEETHCDPTVNEAGITQPMEEPKCDQVSHHSLPSEVLEEPKYGLETHISTFPDVEYRSGFDHEGSKHISLLDNKHSYEKHNPHDIYDFGGKANELLADANTDRNVYIVAFNLNSDNKNPENPQADNPHPVNPQPDNPQAVNPQTDNPQANNPKPDNPPADTSKSDNVQSDKKVPSKSDGANKTAADKDSGIDEEQPLYKMMRSKFISSESFEKPISFEFGTRFQGKAAKTVPNKPAAKGPRITAKAATADASAAPDIIDFPQKPNVKRRSSMQEPRSQRPVIKRRTSLQETAEESEPSLPSSPVKSPEASGEPVVPTAEQGDCEVVTPPVLDIPSIVVQTSTEAADKAPSALPQTGGDGKSGHLHSKSRRCSDWELELDDLSAEIHANLDMLSHASREGSLSMESLLQNAACSSDGEIDLTPSGDELTHNAAEIHSSVEARQQAATEGHDGQHPMSSPTQEIERRSSKHYVSLEPVPAVMASSQLRSTTAITKLNKSKQQAHGKTEKKARSRTKSGSDIDSQESREHKKARKQKRRRFITRDQRRSDSEPDLAQSPAVSGNTALESRVTTGRQAADVSPRTGVSRLQAGDKTEELSEESLSRRAVSKPMPIVVSRLQKSSHSHSDVSSISPQSNISSLSGYDGQSSDDLESLKLGSSMSADEDISKEYKTNAKVCTSQGSVSTDQQRNPLIIEECEKSKRLKSITPLNDEKKCVMSDDECKTGDDEFVKDKLSGERASSDSSIIKIKRKSESVSHMSQCPRKVDKCVNTIGFSSVQYPERRDMSTSTSCDSVASGERLTQRRLSYREDNDDDDWSPYDEDDYIEVDDSESELEGACGWSIPRYTLHSSPSPGP